MSLCDQKIFQAQFLEWNQSIQRFLQSRGLAQGDAADLTQESFIKLWNKCKEVAVDKAGAFLFKVARNLSIDHFRKSKTRLKYQESVNLSEGHIVDGQYELEAKEFKARLEEAIDTMTDASREVFLMHRMDGRSYKDIASFLDISVKAVEKRMSKALRHLEQKKIFTKR